MKIFDNLNVLILTFLNTHIPFRKIFLCLSHHLNSIINKYIFGFYAKFPFNFSSKLFEKILTRLIISTDKHELNRQRINRPDHFK